ncbi:hypothetical protein KAZ57_03950 [Patescibacteria group bacterium]|nr:hypothetical protein [Patescibacteria group bacterium]
MTTIYVALENIRSLYNVGAIFRTCSFFGIYNILLVGYSGQLKTGVLHPKILKTSMGVEKELNLTFIQSSEGLVSFAAKNNLDLYAVEQDKKSVAINTLGVKDSGIFVFGNEKEGISDEVRGNAKAIVEIPRLGEHNSLNVTAACAITLYNIASRLP